MSFRNFACYVVSMLACALTCTVTNASELSDKLQSSEYVLLMRHTRAPGVGDPANYTLNDCKTQRNLSDEGRKQAVAVGNWLKKQGIQTAEVYASAWCRCKDTAELLKLGRVAVEPALASFFDNMEQALILVSHHVNIYEFMGENVASGDMVLAKVDDKGKMISYKLIPRPH